MRTTPSSDATAEWYDNSSSILTKPKLASFPSHRLQDRQHPLFAHTKSVNSCHVCPSAKITSVLIIIQTFVPHRNSPLTPTGNKSKIEGKCNSCHISSAGAKQSTLTTSKVCSRKYNETHSISLIPQMALTVKHYSWLALSAFDWWENILFLPERI